MTNLHRCLSYLKERNIRFNHTTHPHAYSAAEAASAECLPPAMFAKTILIKRRAGYVLAVLPADCDIDLEELSSALEDNVRLASEIEIANLFPNCELGAMPPLGVLYGLPVFADERLAAEQFICFNAGTHRDSIHISYTDFSRVTHPVLLNFARQIIPTY